MICRPCIRTEARGSVKPIGGWGKRRRENETVSTQCRRSARGCFKRAELADSGLLRDAPRNSHLCLRYLGLGVYSSRQSDGRRFAGDGRKAPGFLQRNELLNLVRQLQRITYLPSVDLPRYLLRIAGQSLYDGSPGGYGGKQQQNANVAARDPDDTAHLALAE